MKFNPGGEARTVYSSNIAYVC